MARWIAFDEASLLALAARTHADVGLGIGDPLEVALAANGAAMLMLPAETGKVTLLTLRPVRAVESPAVPRYVAGGFLGLIDQLETDDETPPKKSWWRRIRK